MRRAILTALAAGGLLAVTPEPARRPDPRTASARAALARDPARPIALWVFFDDAFPDAWVARVVSTGARLRHVSRWLRAVSVMADSATAQRIADLPGVAHIQPVRPLRTAAAARLPPRSRAAALPGTGARQDPDSALYGSNFGALRALGIPNARRFGFTGSGVRIAILDTGFEPAHESLAGRRVARAHDFINGDDVVSNQPGDATLADQERHGTHVWSLVGGYAPGSLVGPAYDAIFLLAKVDQEPGDTRADEDRWVAAAEWADALGARIILSSVVFRFDFTDRGPIPLADLNGDIAVTTVAADAAARRGIIVVTAVGDDGPAPSSLSSPADADSVLAIGATDAAGQVANFSARGPTADGRIKPDLVARGVGLLAASSLGTATYDISLAGTSYSAPLIAGGAALVMEAWPTLSPTAIRMALILSGTRARAPDNALGSGAPDIATAILFPGGLAPVSISADLNNVITAVVPEFRWNAPLVHPRLTPVLYRVQVATDSLFTNIVFSDTVRDAFSYVARRSLRPAPAVWWRVSAEAAFGVRRNSAPQGPYTMPGWVRLLSPDPDRDSFVDSERPELVWTPLTAPPPVGPLVYDVEILSLAGTLVQPTIRNLTTSSLRVPQPLVPNQSYRWRVIARTQLGAADTVESTAPFVVVSTSQPPITLLQQNFPNPFPRADLGETVTRIWFDLAEAAVVELAVFDLRGRFVRQLIPASADCGTVRLEPGYYGRTGPSGGGDPCVSTTWDGADHAGRRVARGVYVLRLRVAGRDYFRRMVFLPE